MTSSLSAVLLSGALFSPVAAASPVPVVSLVDPRGDDDGPGTYQYPTNPRAYPRGSLDLRTFEVIVDGNDVVFRVGLGAVVRRPSQPARRTTTTEITLNNDVFAQNIDIYIDTHGGRGSTQTVPGRNLLIRAEDAWDVAVILTPQPEVTRSLVRDWEPAPNVVFATQVRAEGATLVARVPRSVLGDVPQKDWGYAVVVTAAVWEYSFSVIDRTLGGRSINAFTMPVAPVPEALVVGGAPLSRFAPAALDVLVPAGVSQREVLRCTEDATSFRSLPLVYPNGLRPRGPPPAEDGAPPVGTLLTPSLSAAGPVNAGPIELVVAEVQGDLVILSRPADVALTPHRVGMVLDDGGSVTGRIVVTAVNDSFIVATIIEGKGSVRKGARIQFDPVLAPR